MTSPLLRLSVYPVPHVMYLTQMVSIYQFLFGFLVAPAQCFASGVSARDAAGAFARDAARALVRNCGLLRDLLDERLDLDRLCGNDDLGIFEFDGHPIYISGGVHELRETAGQSFHGVPDLRGASV